MMLVDSHCHLDFSQLADRLDDVIARAAQADVRTMVTICTRVRKFPEVLAIAERHENIYCSLGTHPHYADEETDVTLDELIRLAQHPKVVAIGEAGLDYHYDNSPRRQQAESFRLQIAAARETGLPLVIHSRDADNDTAEILESEMAKGAFSAVLHCFTAGRELAERGVAIGLYVSFSGVVTFKKSDELRAIARDIPLERLLVETDAPFLAPEPMRGRGNEPAYVAHTASKLADIRGLEKIEIARATTANFFKLFSKVPPPGGVEAGAIA